VGKKIGSKELDRKNQVEERREKKLTKRNDSEDCQGEANRSGGFIHGSRGQREERGKL